MHDVTKGHLPNRCWGVKTELLDGGCQQMVKDALFNLRFRMQLFIQKNKKKPIKSKDLKMGLNMEHLLLLYNDKHICVLLHAVYM